MNERIFALDIGTRSVVGLLLEQTEQHYKLIDYVMLEHVERSMLDGQIHDIVSVAKVIQKVKEKLEAKHDIKLTKACVAAAGRALKTRRTTITKNIEQHPLIEKEDILFLELSAVQQAQHDLALEETDHTSSHYYCVGYSVIQYKLDDDSIGSLIDQQGKYAEVEIIATFLPKVVVESLLSALQRADLEMEALTLEPIAAINVLIPASMRRINVALVDIGAGTSDIALTDTGTITAYGMVPRAGDEITEAISDHYLLDFNEAERVKKEITVSNQATITDILGFEQTITYDELADAISPAINQLADAIAREIMVLNARAPKAVMLVGGGSLTPHLTNQLAEKLQLPNNRVAIRGTDAIPSLQFEADIPAGPTFITPIGIAIAAKQNPVHYISVTVNDRAVRLFDMKQLTVGDCLLAAGIHIDKLYGRPGMAYMITYNGQSITLPGTYGQPPKVWLNQEHITIEEPIKHGDSLYVEKGKDGNEPHVTIKELVGELPTFTVYYNDEKKQLAPAIEVNKRAEDGNYLIKDHDTINVIETKTIQEFLVKHNKQDILNELYVFKIYINGKEKSFPQLSTKLFVNGKEVTKKALLQPGDKIRVQEGQQPTIKMLLEEAGIKYQQMITVIYNGKPVTLTKQSIRILQNNNERNLDDRLQHDDKIEIESIEENEFIFQDIFRFISVDLSQIKGGIDIKKNGQPTTFFDLLEENDEIIIN
ncbi:cell division protein FtsA [Paraliobacillus quinghaiensis]|uniref:Cell division protein FtsA n=1 Tax=Paraliobacillus quinghaiensis TaxID=470815 RepID=A0A917WRY5_9BACI|nr:cell division protein FtsA [Paraliobacillus quinghaiensis]GGM26380.1 cell division protein FtsA [Paraliobacillus quinghaiensis]